MEIEAGEFVRTNRGIAKIKEDLGDLFEVDKNGTEKSQYSFREFIKREEATSHSFNIIDLIEVRRLCEIRRRY